MIDARVLSRDKPVLIIYNPNSGTARNLRGLIKSGLDEAKIPFEFYETTGPRDSFVKANTFDIDKFSAVSSVGGDGTVHEVVDGMFKREDGKRLPVWIIPNGSGNAYGMNYKITTIESSLEAMKKGHVLKVDVMRTLLDHDTVESVPKEKRNSHLFYCLTGVGVGLTTDLLVNTKPWMKKLFGTFALFLMMYKEIQSQKEVTYDLQFDDGKVMKKVTAPKFDFVNVRYAIHNSIFSPLSIANDGMYEVYLHDKAYKSIAEFGTEFKEWQMGGMQIFNTTNYRFSKGRFTNQNYDKDGALKP